MGREKTRGYLVPIIGVVYCADNANDEVINIVGIGHVNNSGTLVTTGHFIDKIAIEEFEKNVPIPGKLVFKYLWVLEKLKSERQRGFAIDIALWMFQTSEYIVTVIDDASHRRFTWSSVNGTSQAERQAERPVLIVAAGPDEFEAVWERETRVNQVREKTPSEAMDSPEPPDHPSLVPEEFYKIGGIGTVEFDPRETGPLNPGIIHEALTCEHPTNGGESRQF